MDIFRRPLVAAAPSKRDAAARWEICYRHPIIDFVTSNFENVPHVLGDEKGCGEQALGVFPSNCSLLSASSPPVF